MRSWNLIFWLHVVPSFLRKRSSCAAKSSHLVLLMNFRQRCLQSRACTGSGSATNHTFNPFRDVALRDRSNFETPKGRRSFKFHIAIFLGCGSYTKKQRPRFCDWIRATTIACAVANPKFPHEASFPAAAVPNSVSAIRVPWEERKCVAVEIVAVEVKSAPFDAALSDIAFHVAFCFWFIKATDLLRTWTPGTLSTVVDNASTTSAYADSSEICRCRCVS